MVDFTREQHLQERTNGLQRKWRAMSVPLWLHSKQHKCLPTIISNLLAASIVPMCVDDALSFASQPRKLFSLRFCVAFTSPQKRTTAENIMVSGGAACGQRAERGGMCRGRWSGCGRGSSSDSRRHSWADAHSVPLSAVALRLPSYFCRVSSRSSRTSLTSSASKVTIHPSDTTRGVALTPRASAQ